MQVGRLDLGYWGVLHIKVVLWSQHKDKVSQSLCIFPHACDSRDFLDLIKPEYYYPEWGMQRALLQPVKVTGATSAERDNNSYYMHDSDKCHTHGCTEVESGFFEQLKAYRDEGNKKIDVVIEYPNAQHRTTSCKTNSDE